MIEAQQVASLALNAEAQAEAVALLSLVDLGGSSTEEAIIHHIGQRGFLRQGTPAFAPLLQALGVNRVILRRDIYCTITRQGKQRLRDLCELAAASRYRLKKFSASAFALIERLRYEMPQKPFSTDIQCISVSTSILAPRKDHHVYVILLDSRITQNPRVKKINPNSDPTLPCLYVGMTSFTPEERFEHHKCGRLASLDVRRYGVSLVPRLYAHLNPMMESEAIVMEEALACHLRQAGCTVLAGHLDYLDLLAENTLVLDNKS